MSVSALLITSLSDKESFISKNNNLYIISGSFAGLPYFSLYSFSTNLFTKLKSIFSFNFLKKLSFDIILSYNDICSDIVICLYLFSNIKITPNLVFSICSLYHIKNIITRF